MWDTKHRPLTFADVLGQRGTVQLLKARLSKGTAQDTSYIFSGGSGQGKTTLARIFARAMLCQSLDKSNPEPCNKCESCLSILNDTSMVFVEQDAASQGNIEQIRRIVDDLPFTVMGAEKRIYLFDECFTEDTLLRTPEGFSTIKDIVLNRYAGEVLSFDSKSGSVVWRRVTDWFEIENLRDLLRLTLDNGVVLTVTPEQELFTSNRGWVKAQDLDPNDDIVEVICPPAEVSPFLHSSMRYKEEGSHHAKLLKKERLSQGRVYDVTINGTHCFFAASQLGSQSNLILAHNCHRMSKDAQDVLLKPLEERKMLGMFCTTEPEKVRGAIRSRCEEYSIRKVTREDILVRMKMILEAEGVEYEEDAVLIVIDFSSGHVRDVVNRLEMISQIGPVTVANVRENLNLSVVSTYYEILLNIPSNLKEALLLVDSACDKVTPEEVASGLAEAAMNSFRLANGMSADFTFADKALGAKASEIYGSGLTLVAEHFLRSRYTTQIGLICDVTTLHQRLGVGALTRVQAAPAQAIVVSTPVQEVAPPSFAPVAESTAEPSTTSPSSIKPSPPPPPEPKEKSGRLDGKGNLGSHDNQALTENDVDFIPKKLPLQSKNQQPIVFEGKAREGREILPPLTWRREFEAVWTGRGAGDN